jgi:hypothetical protein
MNISFGATCPPLSEQLRGKVSTKQGEILDKHAAAVDRLNVHGLISKKEVASARAKIVKLIERYNLEFTQKP